MSTAPIPFDLPLAEGSETPMAKKRRQAIKPKAPGDRKKGGKGRGVKKPSDGNAITRSAITRLHKHPRFHNWLSIPHLRKPRPLRLSQESIAFHRKSAYEFLELIVKDMLVSMRSGDSRCTVFPRDIKYAIEKHMPTSEIHRPELLPKGKKGTVYQSRAKLAKAKKDKAAAVAAARTPALASASATAS